MNDQSPFLRHRNILLSHYSTAKWLRSVVMSLWNGNGYPVALSHVYNLDEDHFKIFNEMVAHYSKHGESDKAFMDLAQEIRSILEQERELEEREKLLENWLAQVRHELKSFTSHPADLIDQHYSLLEQMFNERRSTLEATESLRQKTIQISA